MLRIRISTTMRRPASASAIPGNPRLDAAWRGLERWGTVASVDSGSLVFAMPRRIGLVRGGAAPIDSAPRERGARARAAGLERS
jgi:hypothetical protein